MVQRMIPAISDCMAANMSGGVLGFARLSQIDVTDQQIDKLVYELYGLIDEEINIVEGE